MIDKYIPLLTHLSVTGGAEIMICVWLCFSYCICIFPTAPVIRTACFTIFYCFCGYSIFHQLWTRWNTSTSSSLVPPVDCKLFSARSSSRPPLSMWSPVCNWIILSLLVFLSFVIVRVMLFQHCWMWGRAEKRNVLDWGFTH